MSAIKKSPIDWEAVELHYRAGIRSLKDIGAEFGVSDAGIIKRAKRDDWERDLRAKIQAKAEAKVSASLVSAEVSAQTKVAERQIVDANAQAVADVRLGQRDDIGRAKGITRSLLDELEDSAQAYELDARVKMSKTLTETLRIVIDMERQAFGMDTKGADGAAPGAAGYVPPAIRVVHVTAPARQEDDDAGE